MILPKTTIENRKYYCILRSSYSDDLINEYVGCISSGRIDYNYCGDNENGIVVLCSI